MKTLNTKRITIWVIEFIFTEIISIIIQKYLSTNIQSMTIKTIIDNAIIIGTILAIIILITTLIYWKIKDYIKNIEFVINDHALRIELFDVFFLSNPQIHTAYPEELKKKFTPRELKYLGFSNELIWSLKPMTKELKIKIRKMIDEYYKTQDEHNRNIK